MRPIGTALRFCAVVGVSTALLGCSSPSAPDGDGQGGSNDGSSAKGSDAATSNTSTGQGAGSGGAPDFDGTVRVDDLAGSAVPGSADVAVAPDGTLYVSWVDDASGSGDVFVARSVDGGATFGESVRVDDDAEVPLVSMARHPYVVANDDRVAVVFNDTAGSIYLHTSPSRALAFGAATLIGNDITTVFRDFPKAFFLADDSLAVAWHGYADSGPRIYLSREKDTYAAVDASGGAPGVPCECCPLDGLLGAAGQPIVAFRNNDANTREMWLAGAPEGGAFSSWTPISTTEGFVDSCPMQGPRLALLGANELVSVWSGRGSTDAGTVLLSRSDDDGASWTGGARVGSFVADEPTIAVGSPGHLFVTGVTGSGRSALVSSTDGGATWSAPEALGTPDGDLATPQAEGASGVAVLAGVSAAGTVWLRRME